MARKLVTVICFGVVCACVLKNYARPAPLLELVSPNVADGIVGGTGGGWCTWQTPHDCDTGEGCYGIICGYGTNGGLPFVCPKGSFVEEEPQVNNPLAIGQLPKKYYSCDSGAADGLTECGFVSTVSCGSIETCEDLCTGGSPLGGINPNTPARCRAKTSTPKSEQSQTASGDTCIVT